MRVLILKFNTKIVFFLTHMLHQAKVALPKQYCLEHTHQILTSGGIVKMKHLAYVAGIGMVFLAAASASADTPSAKFAATWSTTPALESVVNLKEVATDQQVDISRTGYTLATIKVPQDKELLVGVSAEIGIVTDTSIKGQLGGAAKALAGGEAYVTVYAVPQGGGEPVEAAPGKIILSKRVQELSATLGGVIESCTDVNGDGTITVADECTVSDEEIGLLQDTTAAHHFNFILPDMNQGVYDIKALFTTGANADVDVCEDCGGAVAGSAYAKAIINKTMLTVQQVRAAKGGLQDVEIVE